MSVYQSLRQLLFTDKIDALSELLEIYYLVANTWMAGRQLNHPLSRAVGLEYVATLNLI